MNILLVEDDLMVGKALLQSLQRRQWQVQWLRRAADAQERLKTEAFDLLLLDLGLPDGDGLDVLRSLRARASTLPVIIITARDAVEQRVLGLQEGADDYVSKPFDMEELAARILAVIRRNHGNASNTIEHGPLSLNAQAHTVHWHGNPVKVSKNEFVILEMLVRRQGMVWTKEQIEQRIHGLGSEVESNTVEVYIYNLRKKLSSDFIQNMRGVGYFLKAEA